MTRWLVAAAWVALAGACGDRHDAPTRSPPRLEPVAPAQPASATVPVSGTVIDRDSGKPVGDVEVVLRGEHGDVAVRTNAAGTFELAVVRGAYRAFVRDAHVMTTGLQRRQRVRDLPRPELAGAPDEQLMPVVEITEPTRGVELTVTLGALIDGVVVDRDGAPVEGVVLEAVPIQSPLAGRSPVLGPPLPRADAQRPALGTDTVISDRQGRFVLRVPAGRYELVADHAQHAGLAGLTELELAAGARTNVRLTLARGCIITGHVVGPTGGPPHDGALEVQASSVFQFGPSGAVRSDGTFRWTTIDTGIVTMRAWPWMSPPSPPQMFACRDGERYPGVVLRVGNDPPDVAGSIVDAEFGPVPFAFVDIAPLEPGVHGQQERSNASGIWHVYRLPKGRYHVSAHAAGLGVVSTTVVAPDRDVKLQLGGTGTLAGTTTGIVDGSFELTLHHCGSPTDAIELVDDARIVIVRGGRFSVERIPACTLTFSARWRDRVITRNASIEAHRTTYVELELGEAQEKTVHGTVRDRDGKPVADARVTAIIDTREAKTVRTREDGTFTLTTKAGAQLVAGTGRHVGRATVGRANVPSERVDLVLANTFDEP